MSDRCEIMSHSKEPLGDDAYQISKGYVTKKYEERNAGRCKTKNDAYVLPNTTRAADTKMIWVELTLGLNIYYEKYCS